MFDSEQRVQLQGAPESHAFSTFAEAQTDGGNGGVQLLASRAVPLIVAAKCWADRGGYDLTAFTAQEAFAIVQKLQGIGRLEGCLRGMSVLMVPSQAGTPSKLLPPLTGAELAVDLSAYKGMSSQRPVPAAYAHAPISAALTSTEICCVQRYTWRSAVI